MQRWLCISYFAVSPARAREFLVPEGRRDQVVLLSEDPGRHVCCAGADRREVEDAAGVLLEGHGGSRRGERPGVDELVSVRGRREGNEDGRPPGRVGRQGSGQASTEDLRQAMVHYRALFNDLLEQRSGEPAAEIAREETQRGRR